MGWNYRVFKKIYPGIKKSDGTRMPSVTEYSIREVYYDEKGRPNRYTLDDIAPKADTRKELVSVLTMMLKDAISIPVLDYPRESKGTKNATKPSRSKPKC